MPLIAGWTELDELCPTSYQRRKTANVVSVEWCTKLKIVSSANKREAMEEKMSDRGLQVFDLKAAGTLLLTLAVI
jgi:hypothetical protein